MRAWFESCVVSFCLIFAIKYGTLWWIVPVAPVVYHRLPDKYQGVIGGGLVLLVGAIWSWGVFLD